MCVSGAFLIPYFIMLAFMGLPLFYLELAVGQRLRKGALGAWHQISPNLGGVGVSSAVVSFVVALYYNTVIAWCLYYFFQVRFGGPILGVVDVVLFLEESYQRARRFLCNVFFGV